jgi:hypothetical protein
MLLLLSIAGPAQAATPLFPKPFHLVRELDDSLSGHLVRVDEYYAGDRVITIRGDRTAIADYARQELTDIDRAHATYSIAAFASLASALPASPRRIATNAAGTARTAIERKGSDRRAGRNVDVFSADDAVARIHADVAIDTSIPLSRDAFDVVAGGAFPKSGGPALDLIRGAASRRGRTRSDSAINEDSYGLPLEQVVRWQAQGESVVVTNRIVAVDEQRPPPDLITIPAGARRVEARPIETKRIAADSDSLVPTRSEH